jgi:hypothetical protein
MGGIENSFCLNPTMGNVHNTDVPPNTFLCFLLWISQQSPFEITNIKQFKIIVIMFNYVQFNLIKTFELNCNGLGFKV